jgi:Trk K+ transport system NAD-binding subunit
MALVRRPGFRSSWATGVGGHARFLRLESARALMVTTGDEVANLQCALLARERAPDLPVVLRLFDHDLAARFERAAGIHLSRGVSSLAAPAFVGAILGRRATAVLPIGRQVPQIVGLVAEQATDVATLERDCQARVLALPGVEFPEHAARVEAGDELLVIGTGRGLAELERRATGRRSRRRAEPCPPRPPSSSRRGRGRGRERGARSGALPDRVGLLGTR